MKDFEKFLEEITIKGNPGIPGEGGKKQGENDYLSDAERKAKGRLGITARDTMRRGPMPSETEMRLGMRLMELLEQSLKFTGGKERELSKLAHNVFMGIYSDLVERYEIELDIQIVKPGKVKQFMDECEECDDQDPPPQFKEVTEEDIKNEVYKRKIANLIIQGEAKNTKHILHSDEVKEGLEKIYGDKSKEVFNLWDEMTKIADKLDWIIPAEMRADMMERMPDHLAGACHVGWKPKEKEEEDEDEETEIKKPEAEESEEEYTEEDQAPMERFDETPIIRARGIDFPMLLHESVKGLFEVLSLGGIPEDERAAKIALANTGLSDEPEDWKYGPEIASDIRDFVNKNPNIDKYPNVREEFYKMMIDKETMPTAKFLQLMRGILSGTEEARTEVDKLIDKVITNIGKEKSDMDKYNRDMEDYKRRKKEYDEEGDETKDVPEWWKEGEKSDVADIISKSENEPVDYSKMSQSDLKREIDNALDDGDYDRVKTISQYLKEGKEIYLREIERINESHKFHTRRNNIN